MKELTLDTTLGCKACEAKVQPLLDKDPRVIDWEVIDGNILRVVTEGACQKCVNKIIGEAGYEVKEQINAKEVDPKDFAHKITHEIPVIEYDVPEFSSEDAGKYYCPMMCEGEDKLYESAGDCPVCGMPLEKIPEPKPAVQYACPNHPDELYDEPGDCPICGTALEPVIPEEEEEKNEAYEDMKKRFQLSLLFTIPVVCIAMLGHIFPPIHHAMLNLMSQTAWNWVQFLLTIPMVFYTGSIILKRAWSSLVTRNLNMWTLIGIGTVVAFSFSVFALLFPDIFPDQFKENGAVHVYFEATSSILLLVMIGQLMELRAHAQTNSALKALLKWAPSTATVIRNGKDLKVAIEHIVKGDIIRIKPGEKIPVDGVITEGSGTVDQSMITGEPIPVDVAINDKVTSGSINTNGSFLLKAEKVGGETLLSKVIGMVNDASRSRAPIQKIADQISTYFVPIVVSVAILTFIVWMFFYNGENASTYALVNAVAVLLIACPCALGLATPMSIMVGTGKGAQYGILIKDAEALQGFSKVDILMIDKTGTLTEGKPTVKEVISFDDSSTSEIISYAASLDQNSDHPLAKAIVKKVKEEKLAIHAINDYQYLIGKGGTAVINENKIAVGNHKLVALEPSHQEKINSFQKDGATIVYVSKNEKLIGGIVITDPIKTEAVQQVKALQEEGIKVMMLTGDNEATANYVAEKVGVDSFKADCLPEDKLKYVKEYQERGFHVAMAGDGINDAPALTQANIGIAMGDGTDIAIQSAEITLLKGNLNNLVKARKLSEKVMVNIKQNLIFAFFYNVLGVPVAAGVLFPFFGILLSPMLATLAMSFSSVSVITNALRLKRLKL
ncbi:copper-transporting P-type ATPase [Flammeovirga aprica]|uniref:Heavy metal translocating P-type ATPase n=1 Tax=Flammeovirga aprica JL-4 TaxID=694437 RepID=A0A7X9RW49_9BACT|nr:copper-translocating P-type ATPase [Flammeovirga aprica]NME69827.1 heavy metal translocating P-type ATPase [Flammeovirga aprica JL-4]